MNLLASGAWALDIVFFVIILGSILLGAFRGFAKGICKWAGTIFSVVIATGFCISLKNSFEAWFGMTSAIAAGVKSTLLADWLSVAICFVILVIVVRLGAWLLGILASGLIKKSDGLRRVDSFLGGLLGLLYGFVAILILLGIVRLIPVPAVQEFVSSSTIVGAIYHWDWFTLLKTVI